MIGELRRRAHRHRIVEGELGRKIASLLAQDGKGHARAFLGSREDEYGVARPHFRGKARRDLHDAPDLPPACSGGGQGCGPRTPPEPPPPPHPPPTPSAPSRPPPPPPQHPPPP